MEEVRATARGDVANAARTAMCGTRLFDELGSTLSEEADLGR
jgi:hypothetical protein